MKKCVLFVILLPLFGLISFTPSCAQQGDSANLIRLNQVGFYPNAPKIAIIEQDLGGPFYLVSEHEEDTLFTGQLSGSKQYQYRPRTVRRADFSEFTRPGSYKLFVSGVGNSHPFSIAKNIHKEVADAATKSYYFQRASTSLPEEFAGRWHRQAGHPDDSVLIHPSAATPQRPEGMVISSPKGWYDAGDYNKYIVNSGITMGTMLSLIEDYPSYASNIELNIPKNNNAVPDLLDELMWNLRWMLTMQDPHNGGGYHKMTSAGFSGTVMPAEDTDARYVVQKSVTATLDFAAVMAQASRVLSQYEQQFPGLADSCLSAAEQAWQWARQHPDQLYNQGEMNERYDPDISTGAYGDSNTQDEFI